MSKKLPSLVTIPNFFRVTLNDLTKFPYLFFPLLQHLGILCLLYALPSIRRIGVVIPIRQSCKPQKKKQFSESGGEKKPLGFAKNSSFAFYLVCDLKRYFFLWKKRNFLTILTHNFYISCMVASWSKKGRRKNAINSVEYSNKTCIQSWTYRASKKSQQYIQILP